MFDLAPSRPRHHRNVPAKKAPAWIAAIAAALMAGSAFAQGIDYGRVQHSTLEALSADLASHVVKDLAAGKSGDRAFDPRLSPWVVEVSYAGSLRPMDADEATFIHDGFKSIQQGALGDLYAQSMLFRADGKDYRLPVQSALIPYFTQELKPGDKVDLVVLQAGGLLQKAGWEWLFLVVDFQKPQAGKP